MAKRSITMKPLFQDQDLVFYEVGNDFSNWEFINESDAEDSDSDSLHSLENGFVSWSSPRSPKRSQEIIAQDPQQNQDVVFHVSSHDREGDNDADDDDGCVYRVMPILFPAARVQYGYEVENVDDEEEEDDDDDDDGCGYGLDDELVPWNVGGKLGRQRIRKLGKKIFPKRSSSKRSPIIQVRPGCVHGKHGLGLKA